MGSSAGGHAGRARPWSPWGELSRRPDIWVHRCRLDEGAGWWCPTERVILLDERLSRREARCVLAHELGHVALEHSGLPDVLGAGRAARRLEGAADRWASTRLIRLAALGRALVLHPDDAGAAAAELDVTTAVLSHRLQGLCPHERARLARGGVTGG